MRVTAHSHATDATSARRPACGAIRLRSGGRRHPRSRSEVEILMSALLRQLSGSSGNPTSDRSISVRRSKSFSSGLGSALACSRRLGCECSRVSMTSSSRSVHRPHSSCDSHPISSGKRLPRSQARTHPFVDTRHRKQQWPVRLSGQQGAPGHRPNSSRVPARAPASPSVPVLRFHFGSGSRGRKLSRVHHSINVKGLVISEEIVGSIIIGRLPQTGDGNFSQAIPVSVEQGDIGTKEAGSLWLIFNRSTVDVEISQTASGDVVTLIPSMTGHLIQPTDHNAALSARLT